MTKFGEGVDRAFRLSVFDASCDVIAKITQRASWECIHQGLVHVYETGGYVRLIVSVPVDSVIEQVTMSALPGKFRLSVLRRSSDIRETVYEWWEPGDAEFRGDVAFGDDKWDARTVCSDINVALDVFSELFETGGLEESIKGMRSYWDPKPWE